MVTDHYDRIAEGVEDKPHESIADMILEGYERGKNDADLTIAYMVGFEKGKDAARDDTAELAEALRAWQKWTAKHQASLYFSPLSEEAYEELGRLVTDSDAVLARVKGGAK
jgi:hypothetical protein